jgi:hypothetical protein
MTEGVVSYSELTLVINKFFPYRCSCGAMHEDCICDTCAVAFAAGLASDELPELRNLKPSIEFNVSKAINQLSAKYSDNWTADAMELLEWLQVNVSICTWKCETCGQSVEFEDGSFVHYNGADCGTWSIDPIYVSL